MTRALLYTTIIVLFALVTSGCVHTPSEDASGGTAPSSDAASQREPENAAQPEPGAPTQAPEQSRREPAELIMAARKLSPEATYPIRRDSTVLAAVTDADGNGKLDVALLTVNADEMDEPPRFEELSRGRHTGNDDTALTEFFFELYLGRSEGLELFDTRRIGRFRLVEEFTTRRLSEHTIHPTAFAASFLAQSGHQEHWLVVGQNNVSTFALPRTSSISTVVVDIDDDGVSDVLKAQSAFEEGRGNETFLTWYRWNGNSFVSHATTNIVRNLNSFLQELEADLAAGRHEQFLSHANSTGDPEGSSERAEALEVPWDEASPVERIGFFFEPDDVTVPLQLLLENREIKQVAFPRLLENPFPSPGERTAFVTPVRVEVQDGASFYYTTAVTMSPNPFEPPQFRLSSPRSIDAYQSHDALQERN